MRETTLGAITGSLAAPGSPLLGRFDNDGRLQWATSECGPHRGCF
ncbi:hypothetical protein ABZ379_00130 [Streptomyces canus]